MLRILLVWKCHLSAKTIGISRMTHARLRRTNVTRLFHLLKGQLMRNNRRGFALSILLTLAFFLIFCASTLLSQSTVPADSTMIALQFNSFQKALLARDTASLGDFYTRDAVSLLQNQPARRGQNPIVERWKRSLANPIALKLTSAEINVSPGGQDAFQYGTFEIHTADATGTLLASGKILYLWRKQSDGWRIAVEMDNFDARSTQKPSTQGK